MSAADVTRAVATLLRGRGHVSRADLHALAVAYADTTRERDIARERIQNMHRTDCTADDERIHLRAEVVRLETLAAGREARIRELEHTVHHLESVAARIAALEQSANMGAIGG